MADFAGRQIAIIGMARTGMAAAEVLSGRGAVVTLHDAKAEGELADAIAEARRLGVEFRVGERAYSGIEEAAMIVPSPGMRPDHEVLSAARARGARVVAEIEVAYEISPAPILAVTGTNGKTTTTALLGAVIEACGKRALVGGNIAPGIPLITRAAAAREGDVLVAEISTFQLEQIESFRPKVGVLTNISTEHMDRHGTMANYMALKARLFENQRPDDFAVINADNALAMEATAGIRSRRLLFSRLIEPEQGAFLRGDEMIVRFHGRELLICTRDRLSLRGDHNAENALATLAAAAPFGLAPAEIARAFEEFREVEHRMERVVTVNGVEFINNSMCTNTDAAVRSLEAMEKPTILIAGGKDKGSDFAPLGEAIARRAKHLVLIGADGDKIGDAARSAGFERITSARTLREAVRSAYSLAAPGDAVMLSPACASFDMFKDFLDRGHQFKAAANELAES